MFGERCGSCRETRPPAFHHPCRNKPRTEHAAHALNQPPNHDANEAWKLRLRVCSPCGVSCSKFTTTTTNNEHSQLQQLLLLLTTKTTQNEANGQPDSSLSNNATTRRIKQSNSTANDRLSNEQNRTKNSTHLTSTQRNPTQLTSTHSQLHSINNERTVCRRKYHK